LTKFSARLRLTISQAYACNVLLRDEELARDIASDRLPYAMSHKLRRHIGLN